MRRKYLENDLKARLGNHFSGTRVPVLQPDLPTLASSLASANIADVDEFACSEILLCAEAYYKVS